MRYDYIIIGGGLSGLVLGIILSKEKKKVLILEQHLKAGGYLHSFYRNRHRFETGFHFVSELSKDRILNYYWSYLGILDNLNLIPYNIEHFNSLIFPDDKYEIPAGLDNLETYLIKVFPKEKDTIIKFIKKIREIKRYFVYFNRDHKGDIDLEHKSFDININDFLDEIGTSKKLKSIILAHSFLYGVPPKEAPLGTHAIFFNALYSQIYDIEGGGDALIKVLVETLRKNGGEILFSEKVVEIVTKDKKIDGVKTHSDKYYEGDNVVSSINPKVTLPLFTEKVFRGTFTDRIEEMENTLSHFGTYNISNGDINLPSYDILYFPSYDIDDIYNRIVSNDFDDFFIYITSPTTRLEKSSGKHIIETLSIDDYKNYKRWEGSNSNKRDEDYNNFKKLISKKIIDKIYKIIPETKENIENTYSSTPLTNYNYTLSPNGSIYGIKHNMKQMHAPIRARTKLEGFYFTGQSLIFPGIVGVTITAFVTAAEILGEEYLFKKIDEEISINKR